MSERLSEQIEERATTTRDLLHHAASIITKQNHPRYAYKTIRKDRDIRVLKLFKGERGSPLKCCLQNRALIGGGQSDGAPNYTALSYYWGKDKAKYQIEVYGLDEAYEDFANTPGGRTALRANNDGPWSNLRPSVMLIQENLNAALHQLRSDEADTIVWNDALCINQEDISERAAQVSLMHEVYMQAQEVCIWLGPGMGVEETDKTFDFLNKILNLPELDHFAERLEANENDAKEDCRRVVNLMRNEYFGRRWVIQELALATTARVHYGHRDMPWMDFSDAIALLMTKHDKIRKALKRKQEYSIADDSKDTFSYLDAHSLGASVLVEATSNLFRRSKEGKIIQRLRSLEDLVSSVLHAFEAKDPRDTVFAVLQIAKDTAIEAGQNRSPQKLLYSTILQSNLNYLALYIVILIFLNASWILSMLQPSRSITPFVDSGGKTIDGEASATSTSLLSTIVKVLLRLTRPGLIIFMLWVLRNLLISLSGSLQITQLPKNPAIPYNAQISRTVPEKSIRMKQNFDPRLEPNYNKCLKDVCAGFIEYCIEQSHSLDILCRPWAPAQERRQKNFPSWILSLEGHAFGLPGERVYTRLNGDSFVGTGSARYRASGKSLPDHKFGKIKVQLPVSPQKDKDIPGEYAEKNPGKPQEDPPIFDGTLSIKGFQLGIIEHIGKWTGSVLETSDLEILGWPKNIKASDASVDQIWRTLVANRGPDGGPVKNWYRRACMECLKRHTNEPYFNINEIKDLKGTPESMKEFLDRIWQVVCGRTCFRTFESENGRTLVGLGPQKAQTNDLICIFFGCSVPVALREIRGTSEYKFIGECYVDGMMEGEAMEQTNETEIEWFKMR